MLWAGWGRSAEDRGAILGRGSRPLQPLVCRPSASTNIYDDSALGWFAKCFLKFHFVFLA